MTQEGTVHPSLTAAASGAQTQSSSKTATPPSCSRDTPLFAGFMKASRLVTAEHSSSHSTSSGELAKPETSSRLLSGTKVSPTKTGVVSSCDSSLGQTSGGCDGTRLLLANEASADSSLCDNSLARTVNGTVSFVSASRLLPVAKTLPRNGLWHDNGESFVSASRLLPAAKTSPKTEPRKSLGLCDTGGGGSGGWCNAVEKGGESDSGEKGIGGDGGERGGGEDNGSDAAGISSKSSHNDLTRKRSNSLHVRMCNTTVNRWGEGT